MSDMKRCIQCGLLKDEERFRKYTYSKKNETDGRYRMCRECESLNSRFNKLLNKMRDYKVETTPEEEEEYSVLCELYERLEAKGLRTPRTRINLDRPKDMPKNSTISNAKKLLEFYDSTPISAPKCTVVPKAEPELPAELKYWLDSSPEEWDEKGLSPEYLQETVYESLKAKYRPQTGINPELLIPVYDDTYKQTLNDILRRFDDYEEAYAMEAEGE